MSESEAKLPWFRRWFFPKSPLPTALFLVPFCIFGYLILIPYHGVPAISWMYVYDASDFADWDAVWEFFTNLQTGLSPFWTFWDIVSHRLVGNYDLTAVWAYKITFIGAFAMSFLVFARKKVRLIASFVFAFLYLWAAVLIHPGNAQVYDVYYPFLVLAFVWALQVAVKEDTGKGLRMAMSFAAGLLLSITELTRPFVIYLFPFILAFAGYKMWPFPKRNLIAFLLPILIFSGAWHAKFLFQHGQIVWSNHAGYNLYRAWAKVVDEMPELEEEMPGLHGRKMPNIDTEIHTRNSAKLKKAVVEGIVKHPRLAISEGYWNLKILLDGKRRLFDRKPEHPVFWVYKPVVYAGWLLLLGVALAVIWRFWKRREERKKILGDVEVFFVFFVWMNVLLMGFGDKGEDARFLIALLPFFAAFPGIGYLKPVWERLTSEASRRLSGRSGK